MSETADYSALIYGVSNRLGHFILNAERGRWDFETLLEKARLYSRRRPKLTFIVEAAGSGISLIQYLRKRAVPCFHRVPRDDKLVRAARVLPIFNDGRVFFVGEGQSSEWIEPLLNELVNFPHGRFDDFVDSLTQALSWSEPRTNRRARRASSL